MQLLKTTLKTFFLLALNFALSAPAFATEGGFCLFCRHKSQASQQAPAPIQPSPTKQQPVQPSYPGSDLNPNCRKFVGNDGSNGAWGRDVYNVIQSRYANEFTQSIGTTVVANKTVDTYAMDPICPKFGSLSSEDKMKALVWFFMALAQEESSCQSTNPHAEFDKNGRRINPTAGFGLYAAERDNHKRSGRSRSECAGDITQAHLQITCAIFTLANEIRNSKTMFAGYFGTLQRYDRQILPHMQNFNGCF